MLSYRTILVDNKERERPIQAFHPTGRAALEWAQTILKANPEAKIEVYIIEEKRIGFWTLNDLDLVWEGDE